MSGKGDNPRPFSVPEHVFSNNWDSIFGKKDIDYLADAAKAKQEGKTYEQWAESSGYIDSPQDRKPWSESIAQLWRGLIGPSKY